MSGAVLNGGVELPSPTELHMADQLRGALRVAEGTTYEQRLRDVLQEMLEDMLYSQTLAAQVMKELDGAAWLAPSTAIRRRLGEGS